MSEDDLTAERVAYFERRYNDLQRVAEIAGRSAAEAITKTTPPPTPDASRCRRASTSRARFTFTAAYLFVGVPIALIGFALALWRLS